MSILATHTLKITSDGIFPFHLIIIVRTILLLSTIFYFLSLLCKVAEFSTNEGLIDWLALSLKALGKIYTFIDRGSVENFFLCRLHMQNDIEKCILIPRHFWELFTFYLKWVTWSCKRILRAENRENNFHDKILCCNKSTA